jgi:hypothetical protein
MSADGDLFKVLLPFCPERELLEISHRDDGTIAGCRFFLLAKLFAKGLGPAPTPVGVPECPPPLQTFWQVLKQDIRKKRNIYR